MARIHYHLGEENLPDGSTRTGLLFVKPDGHLSAPGRTPGYGTLTYGTPSPAKAGYKISVFGRWQHNTIDNVPDGTIIRWTVDRTRPDRSQQQATILLRVREKGPKYRIETRALGDVPIIWVEGRFDIITPDDVDCISPATAVQWANSNQTLVNAILVAEEIEKRPRYGQKVIEVDGKEVAITVKKPTRKLTL